MVKSGLGGLVPGPRHWGWGQWQKGEASTSITIHLGILRHKTPGIKANQICDHFYSLVLLCFFMLPAEGLGLSCSSCSSWGCILPVQKNVEAGEVSRESPRHYLFGLHLYLLVLGSLDRLTKHRNGKDISGSWRTHGFSVTLEWSVCMDLWVCIYCMCAHKV